MNLNQQLNLLCYFFFRRHHPTPCIFPFRPCKQQDKAQTSPSHRAPCDARRGKICKKDQAQAAKPTEQAYVPIESSRDETVLRPSLAR